MLVMILISRYLQLDIWLHLSSMETHCPSLQVNCPEPQEVTLTLTSLEAREEVQGSSSTREKSNMCTPSSSEDSRELLERDLNVIMNHHSTQFGHFLI